MKDSSTILYKYEKQIATITLNRPEVHNAIDFDMWVGIKGIVDDISQNSEIKVVIFNGSGGKAFSSGADIKDFPKHRRNKKQAIEYAKAFEGTLDAIAAMPQPTIAMIQGICAGGGCELAMMPDIRIAGTGSSFSIPVAKIGVLLGYKEMRRLVQLVGPSNASYLLLSAKVIDEDEAFSMGLINEIVSSGILDTRVISLANTMAEFAPLTQSGNKRVLQTVLSNPNLENLSKEQRDFPLDIFETLDSQEGYQAFIEKRKPHFKGR